MKGRTATYPLAPERPGDELHGIWGWVWAETEWSGLDALEMGSQAYPNIRGRERAQARANPP